MKHKWRKGLLLSIFLWSTAAYLHAQLRILPGDKSVNFSLIQKGKFTMGYYVIRNNNEAVEICEYETEINSSENKFMLHSSLNFLKSEEKWKEHITAEANSFKPVSRKSERDSRSFQVQYSGEITGEYTDNKTGKKKTIKIAPPEACFDIATYPYVICALPLVTGYKAAIPVVDIDAANNKKVYDIDITDVKSGIFHSPLTGDHQVWKVGVTEESTGNSITYEIDKKTRKIYRIGIASNGTILMLVDKETDFNPFKTIFNKKETLALVNDGNSVIYGEAFAAERKKRKEFQLYGDKQYAPKGTKVLLIPYTAYYKEWIEINKNQAKLKNARPIPLPKEARECIKYTEIYDDKGHFEFTGLKPGEFLVYSIFGYTDTYTKNLVTGYTDTYVNSHYQGTVTNTEEFEFSQNATAKAMRIFSVKQEGERLHVKLRDPIRWIFGIKL